MRTKTEYLVERNDDGKTKISKVGLRPMQREGVEYEFDVIGDLDTENTLVISKTRCQALNGVVLRKPGEDLARTLWDWLNDGEPVVSRAEAAAIIDAFEVVKDKGERAAAKAEFISLFGRPEQVTAIRKDEALAWINDLVEQETAPDDSPPIPLVVPVTTTIDPKF
jgi:hypothetical protein